MSEDSLRERLGQPLTRRQVLHGALVGGVTIGAGGLLSACGGSISPAVLLPPPVEPIKPGGSLRVGATGGGSKDVIDAHLPAVDPDIMRNWNLYESLAKLFHEAGVEFAARGGALGGCDLQRLRFQ